MCLFIQYLVHELKLGLESVDLFDQCRCFFLSGAALPSERSERLLLFLTFFVDLFGIHM